MLKKIIIIVVVIIVVGVGYWLYQPSTGEEVVNSPLNATYIIEGDSFILVNGKAEKEIVPGAASKIMVNAFDVNTVGDVNADGLDDTAVLLSYSGGGSGTFFYIALAIQTEQGYKGTNTVIVGDRIAPQTTEIKDGEIVVNYADRYPWESFTTEPSVGKSKYLIYENGELKQKQSEVLFQEIAESLVAENWGNCENNECSELIINILDGKDGVWYVQAFYSGLRDDSIKDQKRIASVNYINGEWEWGTELVKEHKCQPNRGHQDFSSELCF